MAEIVNSDQGSQFTCEDWVSYLKEEDIRISMDGKGRAVDNIFIERFFRTLKNYQERAPNWIENRKHFFLTDN